MTDLAPPPDAAKPPPSSPVHALRRRWKPIKDRISQDPSQSQKHQDVCVRLHRAWSWMAQVELLDAAGEESDDARLIYRWIALNALYGLWDEQASGPMPDHVALKTFVSRTVQSDRDDLLGGLVQERWDLLREIACDEYLCRFFWREPGDSAKGRSQRAARDMGSLLAQGRLDQVFTLVLGRVHMARCQLVHGAATFEGQLNRGSVRRCAAFMQDYLVVVSSIIIDHAWPEHWGNLCYPPMAPDDR